MDLLVGESVRFSLFDRTSCQRDSGNSQPAPEFYSQKIVQSDDPGSQYRQCHSGSRWHRGARLVAEIDSAGPALHYAEAEAVMGRRAPGTYVRFRVPGHAPGSLFRPTVRLRGAWKTGAVEASPAGGGPPVANANVKVSASIAFRPDQRGIAHGAQPQVLLLKEAAGPVIEKAAVSAAAGDELNVVTFEPDGVVELMASTKYEIGVVARAEGQDIPGTNGYNGRIVLSFSRLTMEM